MCLLSGRFLQVGMVNSVLRRNRHKARTLTALFSLYVCIRVWDSFKKSECGQKYNEQNRRELNEERGEMKYHISQPLKYMISQMYPETKGSSEEPWFLMPCYHIVHQAVTRIKEVEMARKLTEELYKYAKVAKTKASKVQIWTRIAMNNAIVAQRSPMIMEYACWLFEKCQIEDQTATDGAASRHFCHCLPQQLEGSLSINITSLLSTTTDQILEHNPELRSGGIWEPSSCRPRRRVAIIVPFRDRYDHLRAFLAHLHPILQRQQVAYRVFVIEQRMPYMFNKAALMNAGFLEVKKMYNPDCVLFHDVDTLPERDDNMVVCGDEPIHWGGANPRFNYTFRIPLFGSAVLMRPALFELVNGYTNLFYGWGGEDDNLMMRFRQNGIDVYRGPISLMRSTLIDHPRDPLFTLSVNQSVDKITLWHEMKEDPIWKQLDGLKTTQYEVVQRELYPTHTWVHVNLLRPVFAPVVNLKHSARYQEWFDKCTEVAFSEPPMKFSVSPVSCSGPDLNQNPTRYLKSRVTCQHMCEVNRKCTFFEYHSRPDDAYDPYCVLYTQMDCVTKTSESIEIHKKIKPSQ